MAINRDKVEAAAIKLLQQGKYDKAIAELKKLVEDDPTDVRTLLKLGDTYVKVGNKKESIEAYEKAASIYTEQGFFLKAVAVYKQILRVDANIPELHLKLAELYQQLGLTSDALQHYQNVAVFHEQQGRPRDALDMLKRMVDLDPDNLASRIKLGELFAQQGLAAEATQELRSALTFLKAQQRFDDYVRVGEKLVAYDGAALDVARELAQIYMQRQQPSVALGKLQLCFKADPRNVEILSMIAQAFLDMQQVGKTVSVFKELAKIYAADGKADLARGTWERVLSLAPGDAEAEEALGRGAAAAPRPTVVPTAAATASAPAPAAPVSRISAEDEQLQRLLTETDVYVKYGLKEKAIEHLQKVFAIRPDHVPALEKLKNLQQAIGGRELTDTLRRLVEAAQAEDHPRAGEWRAELARAAAAPAARPATGAAALRSPSASGEGEVILVDDDDEPILDDPSGLVRLDDDSSSVLALDGSQLDEPFLSSEADLDQLPPDEDSALDEPLRQVSSSGEIPRLPTGVHLSTASSPPVTLSSSPPVAPQPLDLEDAVELSEADALVRQALHDINAEDVVAAADELLLEAVPAEAFTPPASARRQPPPMDDLSGESSGEGEGPFGAVLSSGPRPRAPAGVGLDNHHPSLATHPPSKSPLVGALTSASGHPTVPTAPVPAQAFRGLSPPSAVDDEEIERLAREAVADADQRLGDFIEATAVLTPSAEEAAELRALELPPELASDGFSYSDEADAFEEATVAAVPTLPLSSQSDDRARRPGVPRAAPPVMVAPHSSASDEQASARVTSAPAPVNGFEGLERSEEFDPSSFDLPADVKELLRRSPSGEAAARAPAPAATLAPPPGVAEVPVETSGTAGKLGVSDKAHGWEGDPANQFFPDELEEAEFFIQQELLDEAREILTSILEDVPDSGRVQWMLARIDARESGQPEPPAPWEQKLEEQILEEVQAHLDGLGFDGLDDGPQLPLGDATAQVSVEEVLSQFKKGIAETVPEDDAATHYELGIAYREMGLHEDAISEFQIASRAPTRAVDARFLIGLVRVELGQREEALRAFEDALALPTATRDQRGAAEYERGVCLEDLGRHAEALLALKAARAHGSRAVDLERRIRALADKVGADIDTLPGGTTNGGTSSGGANGNGTHNRGGEKPIPGRGAKNIDYV